MSRSNYELPTPPEGLKWRSLPFGDLRTAVFLFPVVGNWENVGVSRDYFVVDSKASVDDVLDSAHGLINRVRKLVVAEEKRPDLSEAVRRANG